jgi:hypothetical protein
MSSKEETYYGYEEHAGSLIASQHGQSSCPLLQTNPQPPRGPPPAPRPEEATPVSLQRFTMGRMSGLAKVVRSTISLLRFSGVVNSTS